MRIINNIFKILLFALLLGDVSITFGQSDDVLRLIENEKISTESDSIAFQQIYLKAWGKLSENIDETQIYFKALDFYIGKQDVANNLTLLSNYYNIKGKYFYVTGNLDSSIIYFEKSIASLKKDTIKHKINRYSNNLPIFYNNLALIYDEIGLYNNAIDLQTKSLLEIKKRMHLDKSIKDYNILYATGNTDLGMMFSNLNDTIAAYSYFRKGLSLSVKYDNEEAIAYSQINYAVFLLDIGEMDSALFYFQKSEKYYANSNDFSTYLIIKINKGKIASELGDIDKAVSIFLNVNKVADSVGFDMIKVYSYEELFFTYYDIKDYKNAENYAKKFMELSYDKDPSSLSNVLSYLAVLYDSTDRPELAFQYLQKAKQIKDSITDADNITTAHLIQAKYNLDDLSIKNEYLSSQNSYLDSLLSKLKLVSILAVSLFIIISILAIFIYNSYEKKKKLNQEFIRTNKLLEQRTRDLTMSNDVLEKIFRILGHDLKGPIGNASLLMEYLSENDDKLTDTERKENIYLLANSLKTTYNLLEDILNWSINRVGKEIVLTEVDLSDLISNIFENLHSTIFTKDISLINNVPEKTFITSDYGYVKTIIRNIVSNSIKFTNNKGKIIAECKAINGHQSLVIKDNGIGMSKEKIDAILSRHDVKSSDGTNKEKGTGMGLLISFDLADKINAKISIESEINKGTSFIIEIEDCKLI